MAFTSFKSDVRSDMENSEPLPYELRLLSGDEEQFDIPPIWYIFYPNSLETDDGLNRIKPVLSEGNPGIWKRLDSNPDWNEANALYSTYIKNKPTIPSTSSDITEGSRLYYTDARSRSSISLTTGGTSGSATYSPSTGVLNIPTYDVYSPTITSNVSRSLSNAAGSTNQFTISTTRAARVYYSVNVSWSITALISTASTVLLEYSTNSGSSWVIVNQVSKNVNLGLLQSGTDDLNISGEIPANALVRIRPSVATNSTITYVRGQEVY